jgi:LysM repeat protein
MAPQVPGASGGSGAGPRRGPSGPIGYAPVPGAGHGGDAGPRDVNTPSWERPHTFEAYPSLRTRSGGIPRWLGALLLVVVAGVAVFTFPFLLRTITGGGSAGPGASSSAVASARVAPTSKASPTLAPSPTPLVYTVKANDTLSKIAKHYGLTKEQLLAANPRIKNPDKIAIGDQIIIPQAVPSDILYSPSPSP